MKYRILLLFVSAFLSSLVHAVTVRGLYDAEINLPANQSESIMLNDAFGLAAERVLIKVSGDKEAIVGDLLAQAKKSASTWVAQHSVAELSELLPTDNGLVPGKKINVTFYQASIERFLSQNNLPVWGDNRPSVLVWVANDSNGIRALSGSQSSSSVLNRFAYYANLAGVPVYAPLLDETDKSKISATDVWGFFEDTIASASKRYQTDAIAALRVSSYAGHVGGSLMVLLNDGESVRFVLNGETPDDVLALASARLAKVFSSRYASVRNGVDANTLNIQVAGIKSYGMMKKTQEYLESISVVRDVNLLKVAEDKVEYLVEIDGDKQKLFNSIGLGRLLIKAPLNALDVDANRVASYQYSGAQ